MALTDNLISYWKLDESSGNAADAHGSNTLTNNNTATYAAAKINNGVTLNGSSQYMSIADASQAGLDIVGDMSIAFWINFSSYSASTFYYLMGKCTFTGNSTRQWLIFKNVTGNNKIDWEMTDGVNQIRQGVAWTPTACTWYHVVAVYDASAGAVQFYVDGSALTNITGFYTSIQNTSAPFEIGSTVDGVRSFYTPASYDEVGIWSRALSSGEVSQLYNSGSGLAYPFSATTFTPRPNPTLMNQSVRRASFF